jgi:hypothetical protein
MDKRYQVFVSSTYQDLKEERQEVIQALLELDCIPAGMELFPAADDDQWTLIKKVIDDCDYYIVIVGGRYGSMSATGLSFTQIEYEYAVSQGKPVIGFIHRDPGSIPASKTEQSEEGKAKLETFRELVQQKMCKYWSAPSELGSVVSRSLVKLIKTKPAVGWVKADQASPDLLQQLQQSRERIDVLEEELESTRAELRSSLKEPARQDESLEPPPGSENLAQGTDETTVHCFIPSEVEGQTRVPISATWDEIFIQIGPLLEGRLGDAGFRTKLSNALHRILERRGKYYPPKQLILEIEDFQRIKYQFWALGLIGRVERWNDPQWTLTEYGRSYLVEILTQPKLSSEAAPNNSFNRSAS